MSELPHTEETSNDLEPIGPSTRHRTHPVRSRDFSFLWRISQKAGETRPFHFLDTSRTNAWHARKAISPLSPPSVMATIR